MVLAGVSDFLIIPLPAIRCSKTVDHSDVHLAAGAQAAPVLVEAL